MYAPITNFAVSFFLSLENVKTLFIWSWVHVTASWRTTACNKAAAHANFSPLRVRNTVKNFTKRSMEISPTWSLHFPAHSKHEKNSLYTLVKFQEERYRCTESKLWVILQESKQSTLLLFWTRTNENSECGNTIRRLFYSSLKLGTHQKSAENV